MRVGVQNVGLGIGEHLLFGGLGGRIEKRHEHRQGLEPTLTGEGFEIGIGGGWRKGWRGAGMLAIDLGMEGAGKEHEEAVAIETDDLGADLLAAIVDGTFALDSEKGTATNFGFDRVGGCGEGGIPGLGEGLGLNEVGTGAIAEIASGEDGLVLDACFLGGLTDDAALGEGGEEAGLPLALGVMVAGGHSMWSPKVKHMDADDAD